MEEKVKETKVTASSRRRTFSSSLVPLDVVIEITMELLLTVSTSGARCKRRRDLSEEVRLVSKMLEVLEEGEA